MYEKLGRWINLKPDGADERLTEGFILKLRIVFSTDFTILKNMWENSRTAKTTLAVRKSAPLCYRP